MKNILLIGFIVLVGCISIKDINNGPKLYTELTKEQQEVYEKNYEIQLLENWYPYLEQHHLMVYSPKEITKKDYCSIIIIQTDIERDSLSKSNSFRKKNNFDKYYTFTKFKNLKDYITKLNRRIGSKGYTSEIIEFKDDPNILIRRESFFINNFEIKTLSYIMIKGNKIFDLNFTSEYKYYEKYKSEALKILKSFRVKKT